MTSLVMFYEIMCFMRADRLLTLLMILQLRGRTTAGELSRQLEVSVRTIFRDIEALVRSGVPINADRGRTGGVRLAHGYQTRRTGLSTDEAQALPFASIAVAAAALGFAGTAESARLKVLAALPPAASEQAYLASERFYLDPADWYRRSVTPQHLRAIAAAVWAGQAVQMDYESWRGRVRRLVEPLGLVLKAGTWYMVGRRARHVSIYRVESVRNVRMLPSKYLQPRNFDLAAIWQKEVSRFETSLRRMKATIRVAESAMSRIDRLGANAAEGIRFARPDQAGWRLAAIWIESINHAAGMLLGFGSEIEVIAPQSLRLELSKRAAQVCALYG
jgi:predicted DNA-binding transcriptional regulator YafY